MEMKKKILIFEKRRIIPQEIKNLKRIMERAKRSDMTEEEWKEHRREQKRKSNDKHRDERNRRKRKWREENPDKKSEENRKYREEHSDYFKEYHAQYYKENKDKLNAYSTDYTKKMYKTPKGRACVLEYTYKSQDRMNGLPAENNVSKEWILENIFGGQKCIYCGDDDWTHLGCDRIDNSKPHTPDNVVCACGLCNVERNDRYTVEEFVEYRNTHPRDLTSKPMNGFDVVEKNGVKVLKKKEKQLFWE